MAPTPIPELRGIYNAELRNRQEWPRIGPVIKALGTVTEALPDTSQRDFTFELKYQFPPIQTFDSSRLVRTVTVNALLLSPDHFQVKSRRQTGVNIQKFTEANQLSTGVLIYLMDSTASHEQQAEAIQSLNALHHFLSLSIADAPPVIVVSDASYFTDCIEGYMKSLSHTRHTEENVTSSFAQAPRATMKQESLFGKPSVSLANTVSPFARTPETTVQRTSFFETPGDFPRASTASPFIQAHVQAHDTAANRESLFGKPSAPSLFRTPTEIKSSIFGTSFGPSDRSPSVAPTTLNMPKTRKSMFGLGSEHDPSSSVVTPALAPSPSSPSLFGSSDMVCSPPGAFDRSTSVLKAASGAKPSSPFTKPHK